MVRADTAPAPALQRQQTPAEVRQPRVLVVEVDEGARSLLSLQLGREGFLVATAASGAEALRRLWPGRELPDALVLSTVLDGEDGYSLCAEIRGDPRTAKLPIVMLAARGEESPGTLAEVVGVDECLARPLFVRDVAMHVKLALAPRRADGEVRLQTSEASPAHLLRALLSTSRGGALSLLGGRASITFRGGSVLDAQVDGHGGLDALVRALVLSNGEYGLRPLPAAAEAHLECSLRDFVGTVFPRLARWDRLLLRSVPLDARLQVDFHRLAGALKELPDAVNGIVKLFDGRRDVRRVLLDSPLQETITLEVVTRLVLMRVVAPAPSDEAQGIAPLPPRLFEPDATEADERMRALFPQEAPAVDLTPAASEPDWASAAKQTDAALSAQQWVAALPADDARGVGTFGAASLIEVPAAPPDVQRFADGLDEHLPLQPSLAEALANVVPEPIPLVEEVTPAASPRALEARRAQDALEHGFFEAEEGPGVATDAKRSLPWLSFGVAFALLVAGVVVVAVRLGAPESAAPLEAEPLVGRLLSLELPALEPIEIFQAHPEAGALLAEATAVYEAGRAGEAVPMLEQVVELEPTSTQAWLMLGLARYDSGDSLGANEAAHTLLAIDPTAARAHLLLATLQLDAKRLDEFRASLQKYLELDPEGKFADEARVLMQRH